MGLRYDLTLPLSRFYAANKDKLPHPFKVIQTDRVFRAERPQKGRLREFVQCDIDILGDESPNAEVELIDVTARALLGIGFTGFTVNINDRRILRGMLESMGFAADTLDSVCITFDKMDKIGAEGVKAELTEKQLPEAAINALADFIAAGDVTLDVRGCPLRRPRHCRRPEVCPGHRKRHGHTAAIEVAYCPSLVRGQGYYTGMVFEITCPQFSGAVAGGGRYDNMVGKFLGTQGARRGLLHRLRARLRHPAGAGLSDPRRQAEDRPALRPAMRTSPPCWPRPHSCATPTTSPFCLRPRSWASSWASWRLPVSPVPPLWTRMR